MPLSRHRSDLDQLPEEDGTVVSLQSLAAVALFAILCLGFHWFSLQGWVPILDSANLALHEAGHPLVGLFSSRASVYGGTLFQIAFPVAAAWHFYRAFSPVGMAASLVWLGENLLNIARYMADARDQLLPLVGGGDHDWTEIFSRWGMLHSDKQVAGVTRFIAVLLIIGAIIWLYRKWQAGKE